LITRTDITRFVFKKLSFGDQGGELSAICDLAFESLGILDPKAQVLGVDSETRVIDALRSLRRCAYSALPIIERKSKEPGTLFCSSDDKMVGIFTSSLLKGFTMDKIAYLTLKVSEFSVLNKESVAEQSLALSEASVRTFLDKLNAFKLHRVWILGEKCDPIGLVTAGDFIRWFYSFQQK
jgi:CBS-domain-containing membrane protein